VFRRVAMLASALLLAVGAVVAANRDGASYTREQVVAAFGEQGYALSEIGGDELTGSGGSGWTGYPPFVELTPEMFLFPGPGDGGPFFVFVAPKDQVAREVFAPLAQAGEGPGVFQALQGNVVVNSDASQTPTGLTASERRRIRAALESLREAN
jgi:hypothetical protein